MKRKYTSFTARLPMKEIQQIERPYYEPVHDSEGNLLEDMDIVEISDIRLNDSQLESLLLDSEINELKCIEAIVRKDTFVRVLGVDNEGYLVYDTGIMIPARFFMICPDAGYVRKTGNAETV